MDGQIGQMNGERARTQLNDRACRTIVYRVLDVGEVVLAATERIDRHTNRRPVRNAAHTRKSCISPVRKGIVIGRQNPGRWVVGRRRRARRWWARRRRAPRGWGRRCPPPPRKRGGLANPL